MVLYSRDGSLSRCGGEGGLAGLKLMAIKTPLAPHPIHYEQHCRRRRYSLACLVLPACPACLGNTKLAARARIPKHEGTAVAPCPSTPDPPPSIRAPSFQICPPLTQAPRAIGRRGGRAAEQACPFHLDRAVSTTPSVPDLQRRRSGSFTCFYQKSVLSSVTSCLRALPFQHVDRRTKLLPEDLHFVPLCRKS